MFKLLTFFTIATCFALASASIARAEFGYATTQIISAESENSEYFGRHVAVHGGEMIAAFAQAEPGDELARVYSPSESGQWMLTDSIANPFDTTWGCWDCDMVFTEEWLIISSPIQYSYFHQVVQTLLFQREKNGNWRLDDVITPPQPHKDQRFGESIVLIEPYLFIGASQDDRFGTQAGAVYIYERGETQWQLLSVLASPQPSDHERFGFALATDGTYLFVGAPGEPLYESTRVGSIHIFRLAEKKWLHELTISPAGGFAGDQFGVALAVERRTLNVAATGDDDIDINSGAIYVFESDGDARWNQMEKLHYSGSVEGDQLGLPIFISGDTIFARLQTDEVLDGRVSAHVFRRTEQSWRHHSIVRPPDLRWHGNFASSLAIANNQLIVGARYPVDDVTTGHVHICTYQNLPAADCNGDGTPDAAEPFYDCNNNGVSDLCEIAAGADDCDQNFVLDSCEIAQYQWMDCDNNQILDLCEVRGWERGYHLISCIGRVCSNNVPDDCNGDFVPDYCQLDDYANDRGASAVLIGWFENEMMWMNAFVVDSNKQWINSVSVLADHFGWSHEEMPVDLLVYRDTNNDFDPSDATLVIQKRVGVTNDLFWQRFPIEPTYVGEPGDVFFVAMKSVAPYISEGPLVYIDLRRPGVGRSWSGAGTAGSINVTNLTGFDVSPLSPNDRRRPWAYFAGTWLIRADASHFHDVPIECMCAADLTSDLGSSWGDGVVDNYDLVKLLSNWGSCPQPCAPICDGDLSGPHGLPDCTIDTRDLFALLAAWGDCD